MSILEKTKALNSQIKEIENLKKRSSQANKFEQLSNKLEQVKESFSSLEKPLDSMTKIEDIQIQKEFGPLEVLLEMVNDFKDRYKVDKNIALEPFPDKDLNHAFINPLDVLAKTVVENLQNAWETWANEKKPSGINEETLNVLSGAGIEGVDKLRLNIKKIQYLSQNLPQDKKTPNEIKKLGESIRDDWNDLEAPPDVVSFLREAYGDSGASLNLFSDKVKKWLKGKGLIRNVKIKM